MRKRLRVSVLLCAVFVAATASPALASPVLWDNGDFDGENALANRKKATAPVFDARVYDDFIVPAGQTWVVDEVFSNNLMDFSATSAYWEIRSGVSAANAGDLIAGGTNAATTTLTGRSGFGVPEREVAVIGLSVLLSEGTYWLTVAPIATAGGQSFLSTTSGFNAIGSPAGNNGNAFWDSLTFNANFTPVGDLEDIEGDPDFSLGIAGTLAGATVPEPGTLILFGTGLAGLARRWRRQPSRRF